MNRVRALVEGQTEEAFVRKVLSPILANIGVFITATKVGKPGRRGGVRPWRMVRNDILATLRQEHDIYCTTMFDFYGLPADWPGREKARFKKTVRAKANEIEQAIHTDICLELGSSFDRDRFRPYIQMHEFEALLFSQPEILAEVVQSYPFAGIGIRLVEIVQQCGAPEDIDDSPTSAPSKRIIELAPQYQKVLHGIIAAERIGLTLMREKCLHFDHWIQGLEALGE